jgi:hydrogenase nickel incorporation protein HypB
MCVVCGCGRVDLPVPGQVRVDPGTGDLDFGAGPARVSVPGLGAARAIRLEADVLGENDRVAARNRAHFAAHGVTALNLVSSPGAGKTTLLCTTIRLLQACEPGLAMAVIEGDQQTRRDADRIRATGVPAIQVNTGKGCHLDAPMVEAAFARLPLHHHDHDHDHGGGQRRAQGHGHDQPHRHGHGGGLLFIENVGNLVCPAMWDLGEAAKVVVLSVTEGDDKPGKYPDMFAAAQLMVVNKIDLLPYVDFDVERCVADARRVNPSIEVLQLSATRRDGMNAWLDWLLSRRAHAAGSGAPCA